MRSSAKLTAEDHRERARQCVRLAQEMGMATSKSLLLAMAQFWMKLAEAAEDSQIKLDK